MSRFSKRKHYPEYTIQNLRLINIAWLPWRHKYLRGISIEQTTNPDLVPDVGTTSRDFSNSILIVVMVHSFDVNGIIETNTDTEHQQKQL